MPWSGGVFTQTNGVYTGATIWNSDKNAGTLITSAHHDTHDYDMAQGINACVLKDGTNTMTILNLSATVNATSGIINVGSVVLASTYGTNNSFFGGSGNFTMTGIHNTGIGYNTLTATTTANSNVALGYNALMTATTGGSNTAIGAGSLDLLTTGSANTAVGGSTMTSVTTGVFNTAIGYSSNNSLTTGGHNVAVGDSAGNVTTGSFNVCIGYNAQVPSATASNQLSVLNTIYGINIDRVGGGNFGIALPAPSARWHLPAGSADAGSAPLKLTAGTNLTTPEDGAIEFDGTHVYVTIGGVRKTFTLT